MNLIQQQNAAKDLPMQYLQQAVNGQNPNLTPWIATAELQRRTTMNQHMQPQGPQGPQPTVKDQVEQKAGLMATQAAQQAQAAQAQQNDTPPGPVPEGIPQPEDQPEEPVMAAHGGLMDAPVSFNFAHGGILGFAGDEPQGSQVRETFTDSFGIERDAKTGEPVKSTWQRMGEFRDREQAKAARPQRQVANAADERMLRSEAPSAATTSAALARADDRTPRPALQGLLAALPKAALPQPAPAVRSQQPPASKPQVAPQADQNQTVNPLEQVILNYATSVTPQASMQGAISNEQALAKAYNLDQPMGGEERNLIAQRNAAREAARQRQALDAFAAYAAGTIGVPGSAGLAYSKARQAQDAEERAHLNENLKDIEALNTAQRSALEKRSTTAGSDFAAQQKAAADASKDKTTVSANVYGTQQQAKTSKYSVDKHAESAMAIAKLQERGAKARQDSSDQKQALAELTQLERSYDADIKSLESQLRPLVGLFTPEARAQAKELNTQLNIARDLKRRVRGGAGAAPAATMAPDRAAQFKVLR